MAKNPPGIAVGLESGERKAMRRSWRRIVDIMAGAWAIRDGGYEYLPRYEGEQSAEWDRRRAAAPWRPEFNDALRGLVSKPFARDVSFKGKPSDAVKEISEDIDGRGNNQTVFAKEAFTDGIAKGVHAIYVDFPPMNKNATREEEKKAGALPYWVHIDASDILAMYTHFEGKKEVIDHIRWRENITERDGFEERLVERIRVLEPGLWQIWERPGEKDAYVMIDEGPIARGPKGLTSIPVALFYAGEREGTLRIKPPLNDLAEMQIELYQALSRQDEILTFAGSPMLCAKGMGPPPNGSIDVGPKRVLFAPPGLDGGQTGFEFVQPAAANIKEIREHVASITDDMRRLGMQPMTQRSGDVTATASSVDAAKAHCAVQAWALMLKDTLEQCWVFTTQWLGEEDNVEVSVFTDFKPVPAAQAPLDAIDKARIRGDISRQAAVQGLQRHEVLPADFDFKADQDLLAAERAAEPKPAPVVVASAAEVPQPAKDVLN